MSAGTFNLTNTEEDKNAIEQGANWTLGMVYETDTTPPVAQDLTGFTGRMQIRKSINSPVLIELTTANGRITLTPLTGGILLALSAADTAALDFTTGVYDLELTSAAGAVTRILQGDVELSKEVTR